MHQYKKISQVHQHVQGLPGPGREIVQPKIMARDGHQEKNDQRDKTQRLEGERGKGVEIGIGAKKRYEGVLVTQRMELDYAEAPMDERYGEHCYAQVPAII
jgi:hypothetical protein